MRVEARRKAECAKLENGEYAEWSEQQRYSQIDGFDFGTRARNAES